jgi:hypothetical protein
LFRAPPFHQTGTFRTALLRTAAAGAQEGDGDGGDVVGDLVMDLSS